MATIISVQGKTPKWGKNVFIAPNATIIGDVVLGDNCSVWFNAVIRGDVNSIRIGNNVNIQDHAMVHATYERSTVVIEDNVSIGHNAIIHGCYIHKNTLIGMGAIVMDKAVIHSNVVIAAGAIVTENKILQSNYIYAGIPAQSLKPLPEIMKEKEMKRIANNYVMYASWYSEKDNAANEHKQS